LFRRSRFLLYSAVIIGNNVDWFSWGAMEENVTNKKADNIPKLGTSSAKKFFDTWFIITDFMNFHISMVCDVETRNKRAKEAIAGVKRILGEDYYKILGEAAKAEENKKEQGVSAKDRFLSHIWFFIEIILVRHVENYLNYLAELLFEIFSQKPETLISSGKIEIEEIMRHDSIDSLIQSIAEDKVEAMSYKSFSDLNKYFAKHFNLTLVHEDKLAEIVKAIEIRNISVHNRCIINERYANRVGGDCQVGQKKEVGLKYLWNLIDLLAECVSRTDEEAQAKFKLKVEKIGSTYTPQYTSQRL
jgi:hypothetical protein